MRCIVTGTDGEGRSMVSAEIEIAPDARTTLWEVPSVAGLRPAGGRRAVDLGVPPGAGRWGVVHFPPGSSYPVHWSATIDFDTVLEGDVDLLLDDGPVHLARGDCAVVTGRHGWQPGEHGTLMTVLLFGLEDAGRSSTASRRS
jgi:quercetin dioxygenase-like cupin family protein